MVAYSALGALQARGLPFEGAPANFDVIAAGESNFSSRYELARKAVLEQSGGHTVYVTSSFIVDWIMPRLGEPDVAATAIEHGRLCDQRFGFEPVLDKASR